MSTWEHLTPTLKGPDNVPKDEYRDHIKCAFTADNRLHCFGLKGVDPTSENWHETLMIGSYVAEFDVAAKKWAPDVKSVPAVDTESAHREHLFSVADQLFLFVYSRAGSYYKLFQWKDGNFETEIKVEHSCPAGKETTAKGHRDVHHSFFHTADGFYVTCESDDVMVARMTIELDTQHKGQVKGAKCTFVARWAIKESFPMMSHVTLFAFSHDHKEIFLWGGQHGCGFRWEPERVHSAHIEPGKVADVKPLDKSHIDAKPSYAFSGPRGSIQWHNKLLLMGGCTQIGLDQVKDNNEIWIFDVDQCKFVKSKVDLPVATHSWAVDYKTGSIFLCHKEKGIYRANAKDLLA